MYHPVSHLVNFRSPTNSLTPRRFRKFTAPRSENFIFGILKFSTPFENFNFDFEIFRSGCRKLPKFDKAETSRDTKSEPPLKLCVFTTNLLLIHLSSQTCFDNLSPLSFVVPPPSPNYLLACFVDPSQGVQSYHDHPMGFMV